ncbi:hypothetical protein E4T43_08916 [Aureobasidium subglaciale]|nr:hypothetical protein E4T43_08916 [Aureobasidium subglaciale]
MYNDLMVKYFLDILPSPLMKLGASDTTSLYRHRAASLVIAYSSSTTSPRSATTNNQSQHCTSSSNINKRTLQLLEDGAYTTQDAQEGIYRRKESRFSFFARQLGNEMITGIVGSGREKFLMHTSLVTSVSGFFAMGLTSSFKKAESGVFEMEAESPAAFSVFVHWIYTNRLFIKKTASSDSSALENDDEEWEYLPRLYTLGERLDAPRFKDAVMSAIIEKVGEDKVIPDNWASYTYQNTVTDCALRRLIVDFHVFAHKCKLLKKGAGPDAEDPEAEFLQDAMSKMADAAEWGTVSHQHMPWDNACHYHEHGDEACHLADEDDKIQSPASVPLRRSPRSKLADETLLSLLPNKILDTLCQNDCFATATIPPGALEMEEDCKLNQPSPLGNKLPVDRSGTQWYWADWAHDFTSNPWTSATWIDAINAEKQSIVRAIKRDLGPPPPRRGGRFSDLG